MANPVQSGQTRVWVIEGGAAPDNNPIFYGWYKIGDPTWGQGDITPVRVPSGDRYNVFEEVDAVEGEAERPSFSIQGRYTSSLSDLLRIARKKCAFDVQVHIGKCANPQDFNKGWDKVIVFPGARITSYGVENLGALGDDEKNPTNESGDLSSTEMFEIATMTFADILGSSMTTEVTAAAVCDTASCGDCGDESDGCQKVFFGIKGVGATPGTKPVVVYSDDAGSTGTASSVTTLNSNEVIDDMACVGANLVLVSQLGGLHYVDKDDLLDGVGVWTEVGTGFVVGKLPNAIASVDVSHNWLAAEDGYIYFSDDIPSGVVVQNAGIATVQDLNAISAYDTQNVVAVGESNAVVFTNNGGETWTAVTGPSVGVNLTAVYAVTAIKWLVATATALYRTEDSGQNWTAVSLPITPTDISKIAFANKTVGYMAATIAGPAGKILRTIDGGHSWYVLPEKDQGAIPTNEAINTVAPCRDDVNVVFGGGLESGTTGIAVKAVGK